MKGKRQSGTRGIRVGDYLKEWSLGYVEHRHATMAAAIAFRGLFSAIPFIVVFAAGYKLVQQLWQLNDLPKSMDWLNLGWVMDIAGTKSDDWQNFSGQPVIWFIGLLLLIYGASAVFKELTVALEIIWEKKHRGVWREEITRKIIAMGLVFGLAGMLILAIFGNWFLDSITGIWGVEERSVGIIFMSIGRSLLPLLTFALLTCIYTFVPRVKLRFKEVWLGALTATVLFWAGQMVMGWFLSYVDLTSIYGAAGSIVMFLIWCYYTALIVLFGAELVRVRYNMGDTKGEHV